jgi:hypothetical protein
MGTSFSSKRFNCFVIWAAKECSVEARAPLCGWNGNESRKGLQRGVERGRTRKPHRVARCIGVDEEWIARGHKYEWSVYDVDAGVVEFVRVDKIATASRHCIINAYGEAIIGKIEDDIRMACGSGNRFHYRTAIDF